MRLIDPYTRAVVWDGADPNAGPVPPAPEGRSWLMENDGPTQTPTPQARGIDYYLGGTGLPNKLAFLNQTFNPVEAIGQSMQASQRMFAPDRTGWERATDAGNMLSGVAGVVAPGVAASRAGMPAVNALAETFTGMASGPNANALAGFAGDESGALRLYHGSPHDFDRFSMDKIGTGEGAQAYGHGLYFAEQEGIAKSYRDALTNKKYMPGDTSSPLKTAWSLVSGSPKTAEMPTDDLLKYVRNAWPSASDDELRAAIDEAKGQLQPGRMYEVSVDANPDDFLDWDAPLSAQPQKVREAMAPRIEQLRGAGATISQDPTGDMLWRMAQPQGGLDKTDFSKSVAGQGTERLQSAGIPGIKYLDAGSRGAGDGSRNYVVFDENLISIVRKYGIAGAATMLGVSALDVEQAMAQGQE